jgi:hypothetical protein
MIGVLAAEPAMLAACEARGGGDMWRQRLKAILYRGIKLQGVCRIDGSLRRARVRKRSSYGFRTTFGFYRNQFY